RNTGHQQGRSGVAPPLVTYKPSRDPKWWLVLAVCVGLGWAGSLATQSKPFAGAGLAEAKAETAGSWDDKKTAAVKPAENKVIVLSQIMLPELGSRCGNGAERAPLAPNGESWPSHSGYLDGYRVGNMG